MYEGKERRLGLINELRGNPSDEEATKKAKEVARGIASLDSRVGQALSQCLEMLTTQEPVAQGDLIVPRPVGRPTLMQVHDLTAMEEEMLVRIQASYRGFTTRKVLAESGIVSKASPNAVAAISKEDVAFLIRLLAA